MSWNKERATQRINELKQSALAENIEVSDFATKYYPNIVKESAQNDSNKPLNRPIFKLPYNKAILTNGVHVYANLTNFQNVIKQDDDETEESHKTMLQFLHLHYSACDRLAREFGIQRVDFHSGRMHSVVLLPEGANNEFLRIEKALKFSSALLSLANEISDSLTNSRLNSPIRIGVDSGYAVAINGGRGSESDPLFLGNPANEAAKLSEGEDGGIVMSDTVAQEYASHKMLDESVTLVTDQMQNEFISSRFIDTNTQTIAEQLTEIKQQIIKQDSLIESLDESRSFIFHQHTPPLKSIKFENLCPSNSIRMPIVSIFADLSGFTNYVKQSIENNNIPQMVSNIHILRGEMTNVLVKDFNGKKIRYIGDCLHGEIAIGTSMEIDLEKTIEGAVLCCGAIRSSFELCREQLDLEDLGISIGLELGYTPITRLGLGGENSVRCSSSISVCRSEDEQRRCNETETAIGLTGYDNANSRVQNIFRSGRIVKGLDFSAASRLLSTHALVGTNSQTTNTIPRSHNEYK